MSSKPLQKPLQVRFDHELAAQLADRKARTGCGTSEFIRRCTAEQLRREGYRQSQPEETHVATK